MSYDSEQSSIAKLSKEYAEGTKRTVFFVGAGGSVEVGLPTWSSLRDGLKNAISLEVETALADEETLEAYRELEELADDSEKFWEFFSCAAKNWPTTYSDYLVAMFDETVPNVPTPKIYDRIWRMARSRQVFTLNVDSLVSRAFLEVKTDRKKDQLLEYDGFSVTDSLSFLARDSFCVINLHGTFHEKSRWIMNSDQRNSLTGGVQGAKYAAYVTRLFSEYNVVFVGLNPSDIAISPFLSKAAELSLIGKHFWICPNPPPDVERWAQKQGVRLIRYSPEKDDAGKQVHSQDICSILDQVESFVSEETQITLPQTSEPVDPESLGDPLEVVTSLTSNRLGTCQRLAGAVLSIGNDCGYSSREMKAFIEKYSISLQIASTVDDKTAGFNEIGTFKLVQSIQSSGISSVWTVRDTDNPNSPYFALKLLSSSGLNDLTERQSFRRGIESMFLLTSAGETVAPKYQSHFEIPLSVVMENIAGSSLREFRSEFQNIPEANVLELFQKICIAVLRCHQSEGQVLHRDVKPGNIMLEGWHQGYELEDAIASDIRLINFDLSWHRFTSGNTKSISADDIGYYAPEQRYSQNSLPPRSAATDVYMLGMVFYFLISGENPPDGGARVMDWDKIVMQKVRPKITSQIAINRVTRMISEMTETAPEDRPGLSGVIGELETIVALFTDEIDAIDADLIVEILAASTKRGYLWHSTGLFASLYARESMHFELKYQQRGDKAKFSFFRQKSDSDNRANFGERMRARIQSCVQILEKDGWNARAVSNKGIEASIRIAELKRNGDFGAKNWENIANQLLGSFD